MEMEQWDEGGDDSYQNNSNTVDYDGNNNKYHQTDDGYNDNYDNNNSNDNNNNNNNCNDNNNSNDNNQYRSNNNNQYTDYSNQVNNDNNYAYDNNNQVNNNNNSYNDNYNDNYSNNYNDNYNRRYVARNNNNNYGNNNNTYRRNDYHRPQYSNRGGYKGRRGRDTYKYNDPNYNRRSNYTPKGGGRSTYQRRTPHYEPKYPQNNTVNNNVNDNNNNDHNTPYQSPPQHIENKNDNNPPTHSNNEASISSKPSRPFRPKKKFTGRQIANDVHDTNDNTNDDNGIKDAYDNTYDNNTSNYNNDRYKNENQHLSYEVDESESMIRHHHQTNNTYKYNNNNNNQQRQYSNSKPKPNHNRLELENLGDRPKEMALQLMNGTYDCMVCQSFIGKKGRIWKCQHCYTLFHIACVNKWARAREQKDSEAEQRPTKPDHQIDRIRCPACNYIDVNFKFNQYKCFCNKVIFDHEYRSSYTYASSIPHSCGDICGKQRGPDCPHTCPAICHPGPCEPCKLPSNRKSTCPCGKLTYSLLCGDQKESKPRLCNQICGKTLKCGSHTCQLKCHEGDCKQCNIKIEQQCFCGKHKKLQPCGTGIKIAVSENKNPDDDDGDSAEFVWKYSCNKICNKTLSCKNHKCTLTCHNGSCSGCSRRIETPTRCACGKSTFPDMFRQSCLNPLPLCKNRCGRMLGCGHHFCKKQCHDSKCNLCMIQIKKKCRCGASEKKFKCHDYEKRLKAFISNPNNQTALLIDGQDSWIRCGKKCKRVKSCGKHTCSEICCRGRSIRTFFEGHQCREFCNKPLSCGRHRCSSYCHRKNCNPCGVTYRNGVECACGAVFVPGPFQCGTKEIPTCNQTCDKILNCGHLCAAKCHHGTCPPCIRICSKPCISHGLMVHNMPCHVENRSCGNQCGKILDCGIHKCNRTCHGGICGKLNNSGNKQGDKGCGQICNLELKCGHKCMYKCHSGGRCNADMCKAQIDVKCKCGGRSDLQYCRGRTEYELKAVPCTEECQIAERNKRFREALNINTSNNKKDKNVNSESKESKDNNLIPYAASVMERMLKWMHEQLDKSHAFIIKQDKKIISPKFVYYVEGVLNAYINDKSEDARKFKNQYTDLTILISSNGNVVVNLKPMTSEQRYIVYCMVTHYHIKAEKKENGGKYNTSYIELSKTKHTRITDYLLSKALIDYQVYGDHAKTLESMPPSTMIVIDNGENVSSSLIQDRLLAWTGDYRMYRNNEQKVYIVFTDINARNSAMTQMKKFGGRKANQYDSINAMQYKKQKEQRKKRQQQQQQNNNNNNSNNASTSKSNTGWSTVGNAHAVTVDNMAKHKPKILNIKMNNRFG